MKKYLITMIGMFVLLLIACSDKEDSTEQSTDVNQEDTSEQNSEMNQEDTSEENAEFTMESFIEAFTKEGIEVDPNEKPEYTYIKAKDGVIFYVDNDPVKIYEYSTEKEIDNGTEILPDMKDWERNGRFVLETSNEKAKEIFKNVQ